MFDKNSIYDLGEPDWNLAEQLIQADTTKKLEQFANENPRILSMTSEAAIPRIQKLKLTDYKEMRNVLIWALELAAAADDSSLHNPESLKKLGINIIGNDEFYSVKFGMHIEPCSYKDWLKFQWLGHWYNRFEEYEEVFPTALFEENEIYDIAASSIFEMILNSHLNSTRLIGVNKQMKIFMGFKSIESIWAGVLEKSSGNDSYIGLCKNCGKPFIAKSTMYHKREFCNNGDKCKAAYNNRKKLEKRKEQNNGKNKE